MSKKLFFISLMFCIIFLNFRLASAVWANENFERLTIYYIERFPYYYTTTEGVKGVVVDRVKLAFEKAKIPMRFVMLPAKRHMKNLKENKEKFCTIGWYKNAERQKIAKYSDYIYQDKTRIALARANNKKIQSGRTVDDILSDKTLALLFKDGYSYGAYIDKKITEHNPIMFKVTTENINMIKMIHFGHGDYFFTTEEEVDALISRAGLKKEDFQYVKFKNMPTGLKRYILCSQKVDDDVIEKVNDAIRKHIHVKMD